jgi:hypothetical protein
MNRRRYWVSLTLALAAGGWATSSSSMAETTPDAQIAIVEAPRREPIVGVGYHPGNFIGPLAFDFILRPLPHIALDVQAAALSLDNGVRGLDVAPELQWEFRRSWRTTPYVGRRLVGWGDGHEQRRLPGGRLAISIAVRIWTVAWRGRPVYDAGNP